jgi:hypothetical protein
MTIREMQDSSLMFYIAKKVFFQLNGTAVQESHNSARRSLKWEIIFLNARNAV